MRDGKVGFYVETWEGGRYGVESWHPTREEAEKRVTFIRYSGRWHGMPPRILEIVSEDDQ